MQLKLTVSSVQAPSLGPDACVIFRLRGGTIGRARDNDWILPDPDRIVSSHHARIHYDQGVYAIEDTSSNGTSLNREDNVLPKGEKVPLTHGDILYIGEYGVQVELIEDTGPPPTARQEAPMPAPDFVAKPYPSREPNGREERGAGFEPIPGGPSPFRDDRGYSPHEETQGPSRSDHIPADKHYFRPPGAKPELIPEQEPGPISVTLPDDWMNETGFGIAPPAPPPERPSAPAQGGPQPDATTRPPPRSREQGRPEPAPRPGPDPALRRPQSPGPGAAPEGPPVAEPIPESLGAPPVAGETVLEPPPPEAVPRPSPRPAPRTPTPTPIQGPAPQAAGDEVERMVAAFFEGLGIDPIALSSEQSEALLRQVGRLMRILTQGTIELLQTRSELKSEFRLSTTMIGGRAEYNPLKHFPDARTVLKQFFIDPSPGSMGAEAAFTEGLKDIKQHEFAVLAGMRAAFDRLLQRLAPEEVEAEFRARGKQKPLLPFGNRTWDFYRAFYADFKAKAADDFDGIFGKDFVRAYEEQVSRLSSRLEDD